MKHDFVIACALVALVIAGCSRPPQVAPANRNLISGLRTAVSSQQSQWLDESAKQLEEGKSKGTISEQEYAEFAGIIKLARDGKWKEAEAETIRLGQAQKPTAEEIERVKAARKEAD
ncbi:MAG TPA: hypothetical protein VNH11_21985 [Pirellulales bacterium]|nr:hypothetical protein [Pirellulales bacterium]